MPGAYWAGGQLLPKFLSIFFQSLREFRSSNYSGRNLAVTARMPTDLDASLPSADHYGIMQGINRRSAGQ
jgi:hypothetical protein